jgi:hypothetical protein
MVRILRLLFVDARKPLFELELAAAAANTRITLCHFVLELLLQKYKHKDKRLQIRRMW